MKKNVARMKGTKVEALITEGPLSGVMSHSCSYKRFVATTQNSQNRLEQITAVKESLPKNSFTVQLFSTQFNSAVGRALLVQKHDVSLVNEQSEENCLSQESWHIHIRSGQKCF